MTANFFSLLFRHHNIVSGVYRILKFKIEFEAYRLVFYFSFYTLVSMWAKFVAIPGGPFIYIDLILLAPFLRYGWANVLVLLSLVTSIIRVVQTFYGFDQLFVSAYFLMVNISGFPLWVISLSLIVVTSGFFVLFFVIRFLPRLFVKVFLPVYFLLLIACIGIKFMEDSFKSNLIGTSFGYLFGQTRFFQMFYSRYEIPMLSKEPYPTKIGAIYALDHGTNLVLIVVESMGVPRLSRERDKLFSSFALPKLLEKYEVAEGIISSRGSTIHGEIRELCNGRLQNGLFGENGDGCVPEMMAKEGYDTTAIHANYASMYGRDVWYPKLGFKNYINASNSVLPSDYFDDRWGTLLDASLIEWLSSRQALNEKSFEYVLTVSTHLPPVHLPGAEIWDSCNNMSAQTCIHLANLKLTLDKICSYALMRQNTTFVIVGDHPPPFVSPASRADFKDFEVPYVILKPMIVMH